MRSGKNNRPSRGNEPRRAAQPPASPGAGRPAPGVGSPSQRTRWFICLLLALAVWAVFGQTRHFDFVNYDDDDYVYENPVISQGLSWEGVAWVFTHPHGANWHPLTGLSHMLDCQLHGLKAGGHHMTNVLLHATNAILLFLLLRSLTGAMWRSGLVAALFAIHPLHVESVAWISERKDVLSGLFFLLTLWTYARYAREATNRTMPAGPAGVMAPFHSKFYWLSLSCFGLGLMSKPMLVTTPFVLLLLDYWPLGRFTLKDGWSRLGRLGWEKLPFLVLSAGGCAATLWAQKAAMHGFPNLGWPEQVGNAVISYWIYIWQMVWPARLCAFYPYPINPAPLWELGVISAVLLLISTAAFYGGRKFPYLPVGWLWYLGILVPVIGLVQVGEQARADRYTYLPQIGLYLMLAWGLTDLCSRWRHGLAVLRCAAVAALGGLLVCAHIQTGYWKDGFTLWSHALACGQESNLAHNNLGFTLMKLGKEDEAIAQYQRALQIDPDYADTHVNLSKVFESQGKWDDAIKESSRALQLNPVVKLAALAHNNLGYALSRQGKWEEAVQQYELSLQCQPRSALTHINYGNVLYYEGKWPEAIQHYEEVRRIEPGNADAERNIGLVLDQQGKTNDALPHYQEALTLARAQGNTGLVQAILRRLGTNSTAWQGDQSH